jgi:hypothetical protein
MRAHRLFFLLVVAVCAVTIAGVMLRGRLGTSEAREQRVGISKATQPQRAAQAPPAPEVTGELSKRAAAMLKQNGFVVAAAPQVGYQQWQVAQLYARLQGQRKPIYVTTDAALHASHLVFDFYLRLLEIKSLRQDLMNLTDAMLSKSVEYWDTASQPAVREAALRNAGYFFVAKALLTGAKPSEMPPKLKTAVEQELALIDEHKGFAASPLFGYKEDYSQYIPRGHYSRSPEFASYFKAMTWCGRMMFRLGPPGAFISKQDSDRETRQAVLICKALRETRIKGETALAVWQRIYETTAYFAGRSDDLTPPDYLEPAKAVFAANLPLGALSDTKLLEQFRKRAAELPRPRILSTFAVATEPSGRTWPESTMGMRFMGQRFAPDSYIFNQLVFDRVGTYSGRDPKPFTCVWAQALWARGFPLEPVSKLRRCAVGRGRLSPPEPHDGGPGQARPTGFPCRQGWVLLQALRPGLALCHGVC